VFKPLLKNDQLAPILRKHRAKQYKMVDAAEGDVKTETVETN